MSAFAIAERTATFLSLVLLIGAAVFRVRIVSRLRANARIAGEPPGFAERLAAFTARTASAAAAVLVALAVVRLHARVIELLGGWGSAGGPELRALLLVSNWGHAWLLQLGAASVVLVGASIGRRLDVWMAIPLAVSAAMNSHAAAGANPLLTISADTMHVLAASAWIGGLYFVLVSTALGGGAVNLLRVVQAFNAVALTCAAIVVSTGLFAAFVHVGSLAALRTTPYGAQLVVKVLFVLVVISAGAWNWRRATPALAAGNVGAIRRGVAVEVAFSLAVLLATARLVILEPPSGGP